MSSHRASKKCLISYIILFVLVAVIVGFTLLNHRLEQHLSELCRYKCGEIVNSILADCAASAANEGSDYYIVRRDGGGRIISAEADTAALNRLQGYLRRYVNNRLSSSEYDKVTLTLGDLTDIAAFSGRGPDINIRYQQSGTADTAIETSFECQGINQTRLRVIIRVSVEFTAFLPTGEENITISNEYIAADTVIVGEIPDIYLNGSDRVQQTAK